MNKRIRRKRHAHRLAWALARAADVLGSEVAARRWLESPLTALGGRTPLDALATAQGERDVGRVLGRLEHGVYS